MKTLHEFVVGYQEDLSKLFLELDRETRELNKLTSDLVDLQDDETFKKYQNKSTECEELNDRIRLTLERLQGFSREMIRTRKRAIITKN